MGRPRNVVVAVPADSSAIVTLRRENRQLREQLAVAEARARSLEAARDIALRLMVNGAPERRSQP